MLLFTAISLLFFGTFGTPKKALAANPNLINFQGKVVNADGTNVANGTYNFNFVLYDSATLGTPSDGVHDKWHELSKSVTVTDGVFQTNLGSATALPDFTTLSSLYLAIQFNSDANGYMTPRIQMTSVPYALNSDNSSALGGLAATNFVQLAQGLQTDSSASNASIAINKTNSSGTPDILLLQKSGKNVLEVNNSGNTLLGQAGASGLDGTLIFNNSAGGNTVTLSLQANPGSSYVLKLPTAAPGLSECLQNDGSTIGQLVFAACATGGSGATSVAYSTTANANGGSITGSVLTLAKADGSNPGLLSADAQTIGGDKTFKSTANSTTAFQVQNSTSGSLMNVDSLYSNIALLGNNDGQTGPWTDQTGTNPLPAARSSAASVVANGFVYVLGGYDTSFADHNNIYYAKLNPDGSTGAWTSQGSNLLPANLHDTTAVASNGYIYVMGGVSSTTNQIWVYSAKLNPDGSTGSWTTLNNNLPSATGDATSVVANGYVYVLGGCQVACGNVVYYAKLNPDGTTGAWQTNGANQLPATRYYATSIAANGYIYVLGGTADGTTAQNTIFYAKLNADGSTGAWTNQISNLIPGIRWRASSVVSNGYVYVLGGHDSGTGLSQDNVYYAKLNADGSTGAWTTQASNLLPSVREAAVSAITNGYVYILGGYGGAVQNTVYYTSLSRVRIGGNLDLAGIQGQSLQDAGDPSRGSTAGSITAGNITAVGNLQVQGQGNFAQGLTAANIAVNPVGVSGIDSMGLSISSPLDTNIASSTKTGLKITSGAITQNTASANGLFVAQDITMPALTLTSGSTLNAYGVRVTTATTSRAAGAITQYGLYVDNSAATVTSASTLSGLYINNGGSSPGNGSTLNGIAINLGSFSTTATVNGINIAADVSRTIGAGANGFTGLNMDLSTNITATGASLMGMKIQLPGDASVASTTKTGLSVSFTGTNTVSTANTGTVVGADISVGGLSTTNASAVLNAYGLRITSSSTIAQTNGTLKYYGLYVNGAAASFNSGNMTGAQFRLPGAGGTAAYTGLSISADGNSTSIATSGNVTGINVDLNSNITYNATGGTTKGIAIAMPGDPALSAGTKIGLSLTSGALTVNNANTGTFVGSDITMPGLTTSTNAGATLNAYGLRVTTGNLTQSNGALTENGIYVDSSATTFTSGGTLNGINIDIPSLAAGTYRGINIAASASRTIATNNFTGMNLDLSTNVSVNNSLTVTGLAIATPGNSGNNFLNSTRVGLSISSAGITANTSPSTSEYSGVKVSAAGINCFLCSQLTSNGLKVVTGSIAQTSGSAIENGLYIDAGTNAPTSGTLNALNVSNVTDPGAGLTSSAVTIGTGWDTGISIAQSTGSTGLSISAASLTTGSLANLTGTNDSAAGGTNNAIAETITVNNTGSSATTNALNITLNDNAGLLNTNNAVKLTLGGSNTSATQNGLAITTNSINATGVSVTNSGSGGGTASSIGLIGTNSGAGAAGAVYLGVIGKSLQSAAAGYTSYGIQGLASGGAGATTYGGYFSLNTGSTATNGSALFATNNNVSANILDLQDGTGSPTSVFKVGDGGVTTAKSNSTTGFQIQDSSTSKAVLTVDTSGDIVGIGTPSTGGINGTIAFYNTAGTNTVSLAAQAVNPSSSITLQLPTSLPGASNYCIVGTNLGVLSFSACGAGSTRLVTLVPEFAGAVMTGDGSANTGTMTSDFCSGSSAININATICDGATTKQHNYYMWTASGIDDYDIWVRWQVPSDFSSWAASNPISWYSRKTATSDDVKMTIYTNTGSACGTGTSMTNTAGSWQTTNYTSSGCTPAAGDILVVDMHMAIGTAFDACELGEITLVYNRN